MAKKIQKEKLDWKVLVGGMALLTIAELYAMSQGINGKLYTLYIIVLAGAIGVTIPNPLKK